MYKSLPAELWVVISNPAKVNGDSFEKECSALGVKFKCKEQSEFPAPFGGIEPTIFYSCC
jgi:hypothetical protein